MHPLFRWLPEAEKAAVFKGVRPFILIQIKLHH